jgi:hypothetical protein
MSQVHPNVNVQVTDRVLWVLVWHSKCGSTAKMRASGAQWSLLVKNEAQVSHVEKPRALGLMSFPARPAAPNFCHHFATT